MVLMALGLCQIGRVCKPAKPLKVSVPCTFIEEVARDFFVRYLYLPRSDTMLVFNLNQDLENSPNPRG
jgi:hypothetical protein